MRFLQLERRDVPSNGLEPLYRIYQTDSPAGSPVPVGLVPSQIRHAYGIDTILFGGTPGNGAGETIAIVDAFDNPSFVSSTDPNFNNSDLHKFDVQFGIPDPPSFKKMDQTGGTSYPLGNKGWGTEIALDVEWAHATAPAASIILIEANNSSSANLYPAAQFVAGLTNVVAVTMSFGHQEVASDPGQNGFFVTPAGHNGVTFLAATGDGGAPGSGYPAYAPTVVAVGGTTLNLGPGDTYGSETGWSGSGGGVSVFQNNPPYQTAASARYTPIPVGGGAGGKRTIPDVAFDADPASGVAVLDSYSQGAAAPWIQVGGTSYSSPSWAGLIAIADQGRGIAGLGSLDGPADTLPKLYSFPASDFHDITSGNNGFAAGVGYDLVTGIGSPVIPALINDLIGTSTVVTNTNDSGPGSLRQAVLNSNALAGTQIVTFDSSVFNVPRTITLTSGAIPIADSVVIQGTGSNLLTVSGNNSSQIFTIDKSGSSGNSIVVNGMDITAGKVIGGVGGAIYDEDEALTLNDVIVENSTSNVDGGGINVQQSTGSLTMSRCIVRNNTQTGFDGGGINIQGASAVNMDSCTISGNKAADDGGGLYFFSGGTLKMTNCTVSGNTATGLNASSDGGGIYLFGTNATIINSTISGNVAGLGRGGGIADLAGATVVIQNSTVAFNSSAGDGGGIANEGSTLSAESTIIAKNTHAGSPDVFGPITENFSMIFDPTGATISGANNINSVDPQLSALAFNGGPTATHALPSTSPAINKGSNPSGATFDQRGAGFPRAINSVPDIGAFEFVPASFLVININDAGPGSLREAVNESSAAAGFQSINFDTAGVFATAQTIKLTTGQLNVTDATTINGTGSANLTVDAGGLSRVFYVDATGSGNAINIIGMTISGGGAVTAGAGIYNEDEALTLNDVTVKNNTASAIGGGIDVDSGAGSLVMNNGQISNNAVSTGIGFKNGDGGGVFVNENSIVTLNSSTVSGNKSNDDGGGVYFYFFGTLNLNNSTVSGNSCKNGDGGGIYLFESTANILNSTISGNSTGGGGGGIVAFFNSTTKIQNSTIAFNTATTATSGGGIWNQSGTLSIESTIVAKNTDTGAPDVGGVVTENFSLIGNTTGATISGANNVNSVDPLLGPLGNNGGPTQTHALLAGSPAINKGSNPAAQAFDQRGPGYPRALNAIPDIGAVEFTPTTLVVRNANDAGPDSLRQCVIDSNGMIGVQTITYDPVFFSIPRTIVLTTGGLSVSDAVTITGPGAANVAVDGGGSFRVFDLSGALGGTNITLSGMTIQNGKAGSYAAGVMFGPANTTINDCIITGNVDTGEGGALGAPGLYNSTTITLNRDTVSNNHSALQGAGLYMFTGGTVIISNCSFTGNTAASSSGALYLYSGITTISGSTFSGNVAGGSGGAIENRFGGPTTTIINSTIANNSATGNGGGIQIDTGTMNLYNCTISNNKASGAGGGIDGTTALLSSTIVGNNTDNGTGPDVSGTITTANQSLLSNSTGAVIGTNNGTLLGVNPLLGPLADNGGPTMTEALMAGSPCINAGNNTLALATDQRGSNRVVSGQADMGAFESSPQFVVVNALDHGSGSLRQCILDSNAAPGLQTITYDPVFFGIPRTIVLTTGGLSVSDAVTITGPGAANVAVDGGGSFRVFDLSGAVAGSNITLSGMTIQNGKAGSYAAGVMFGPANTTINDCIITGNVGTGEGGGLGAPGLSNSTTITLNRDTVSNNHSAFQGAGLYMFTGGTVVISNCSFTGNTAAQDSGALYLYSGITTISGSTFSGNVAGGSGGAIENRLNSPTTTIINSTIANNSATGNGGGIQIDTGTMNIYNCTIAGNKSGGAGGGIDGTTALLSSTIVANNTDSGTGPDVSGTITTANQSLLSNSTGAVIGTNNGTLLGVNPLLSALADNGGPTMTEALMAGSPCINAGNNTLALTTDQRGSLRVVSGQADMGAFESSPQFVVVNTLDHGSGSLRQCVLDANATPGLQIITFDPTVFAAAQTINLTTGEIAISDTVTITGPNNGTVVNNTVAGNRVFDTGPALTGAAISISGLTVSGGNTGGNGGGIFVGDESLTLTNCSVTGNAAQRGGGVYLSSPAGGLTFKNCTISGNTSTIDGAGISLYNGGSLLLDSSTVSGNNNTGGGGGGGLYFWGSVGVGGVTVRNSTIANNTSSSSGGGIFINDFTGLFTIQNSTIAGNTTGGNGGGIANISGGTVSIESSIVSGNANTGATSPDIFAGGTVNVKTSAIGSAAGFTLTNLGGNLPFASVLNLGPLANNGGPTQTMALLAGSPCINAGSNPAAQAFDQRGPGYPRALNAIPDIGAVEFTPTTLVVRNANDAGPDSLRQCVIDSNGMIGVQTITYDPVFFSIPRTIVLTTGELFVSDAVTITGPGAANVAVDGGGSFRVFDLLGALGGTNITLSGMTIQNGKAGSYGAGVQFGPANATINDCIITGNVGTGEGGAMGLGPASNSTTITLNRDTVSNNSTTAQGAGLYVYTGGTVIISNCSFTGNTATFDSGALYLYSGVTTISGSTFSGNVAGTTGGAIENRSGGPTTTIINSTIANNSATGNGGGIQIDTGTMNIYNSTIAGNKSGGAGGGIDGTTALLSSTIVANNTDSGTGPDVSGTITTANQSLLSNSTGAVIGTNNGTLLGVNPLLGPLANNGGPTMTEALMAGSPCINAGNNTLALPTDQRGTGFNRTSGGGTDIGAFEVQVATPPPTVTNLKIDDGTVQRSMITSLTVTFSEAVTFTGAIANAFLLNRNSADAEAGGLTGLVNLAAAQVGSVVTLTFLTSGPNPVVGVGGGVGNGVSLPDGRYTLTIDATKVNGVGGALDGNGDGTGGDNYVLASAPSPAAPTNIFRFYGDVTGDGAVTNADFSGVGGMNPIIGFKQAFGGSDHRFDYNGDGSVAASDFAQFRIRFGGLVP
jgi:hypothetical protein